MNSTPVSRRAKPRTIILLVLAIIAVLALGYIRYFQDTRPTPEALVIAVAQSGPACALVYIAEAQGYFVDAGLDVTLKNFPLGRDALRSVIQGEADISTVYEAPTVLNLGAGQDLGILSTLHTSTLSHALVALNSSGIGQVSDVKGRRIGVTPGTSTEYFLSALLVAEGIDSADITKVPIEPDQYEQALSSGTVDALVAFNPVLFQLQQTFGDERMTAFYSDIYAEASMLVGMREVILAKPEAMTRLLKAIVRALDFSRANQEESIQIVARGLAGVYSEQAVRTGWDTAVLEVKLDYVLLTMLTQESLWFKDTGRLTQPAPDIRRAIVAQYLKSVRAAAVTLPVDIAAD